MTNDTKTHLFFIMEVKFFDLLVAIIHSGDFKFELDNAQNLLVISLQGARWDTAQERVYKNNKILQAYAAKAAKTGGSVVAIKLRGPAKVLRSAKLGKNAAGMRRIFLDIAPL